MDEIPFPTEQIPAGSVVDGHPVLKPFDVSYSTENGQVTAEALGIRGFATTFDRARYHLFLSISSDLRYLPIAEQIGDRPELAIPYRKHFGGFPPPPETETEKATNPH